MRAGALSCQSPERCLKNTDHRTNIWTKWESFPGPRRQPLGSFHQNTYNQIPNPAFHPLDLNQQHHPYIKDLRSNIEVSTLLRNQSFIGKVFGKPNVLHRHNWYSPWLSSASADFPECIFSARRKEWKVNRSLHGQLTERPLLKPRSFALTGVLYRSRCWEFMSAMAQSWAQDTTSWKSPVISGLDSLSTPLLKCSVRLEVGRGDLDVPLRAEHSADGKDLYQLLRQWMWQDGAASAAAANPFSSNPPFELLTVPGSFSVAFTVWLDSHGYKQLFKF